VLLSIARYRCMSSRYPREFGVSNRKLEIGFTRVDRRRNLSFAEPTTLSAHPIANALRTSLASRGVASVTTRPFSTSYEFAPTFMVVVEGIEYGDRFW